MHTHNNYYYGCSNLPTLSSSRGRLEEGGGGGGRTSGGMSSSDELTGPVASGVRDAGAGKTSNTLLICMNTLQL